MCAPWRRCWQQPAASSQWPGSSWHGRECRLTLRSSADCPRRAVLPARRSLSILRLAGKSSHHGQPLSSNVRPTRVPLPPLVGSGTTAFTVRGASRAWPRCRTATAAAPPPCRERFAFTAGRLVRLTRPPRGQRPCASRRRSATPPACRGALGPARGLTLRSSADCPRRALLAARRSRSMLRRTAKPSHRGQPLSSNVRPHNDPQLSVQATEQPRQSPCLQGPRGFP